MLRATTGPPCLAYEALCPLVISALQGCWGDRSSLLMLPHMDDEAVDRLHQQGVHTVPQLATMPEKDAAALLARVLGAGTATSDVQQVGGQGRAFPFLDQSLAGSLLERIAAAMME